MIEAPGTLGALLRHSILRFASVGVVNTLLTITVIFLLKLLARVPDVPANLVGYSVGLGCSFLLNKRWTFGHRGALWPALVRFLTVFCVAYLLNIGIVLASLRLGVNDYLAHLVGMPVYTLAFYAGCRWFAFQTAVSHQRPRNWGQANNKKRYFFDNRYHPTELMASYSLGVRLKKAAIATLCVLGAAVFLFADLGRYPLVMWDESRLAVNALEMYLRGLSIVTTYNFAPDLWNTKPPLQIWLMVFALHLIPDAETALRIPSALAALGTTILTAAFAWRVTRSPFVALLAGVLLLTSQGFNSTHVARTGDYDSLLVFFTTAYLWLLFFLVHRAKVRVSTIVLMGIGVAGAVLTKNIAGLIPGIGVVVYLTLSQRWPRILTNPMYLIGACVAAVPVVTFYVVREAVAPGFLDALVHNELLRAAVDYDPASNGTKAGLLFYAKNILRLRAFSLGPLLLLVPVGWFFAKPRLRVAINYAVVISITFIAAISLSKTRYFWYAASVYPWLAIASSIAIYAGIAAVRERRFYLQEGLSRIALPIVWFGIVILVLHSAYFRHVSLIDWRDASESSYGPLFNKVVQDGFRTITVVDPGRNNAGPVMNDHYNPILRFYKLLYETNSGALINVIYELSENILPNQVVASCSPQINFSSLEGVRQIAQIRGCSAVLTSYSTTGRLSSTIQ